MKFFRWVRYQNHLRVHQSTNYWKSLTMPSMKAYETHWGHSEYCLSMFRFCYDTKDKPCAQNRFNHSDVLILISA